MIVDKVLNNNVISSIDESGREILLAGRGLGWRARSGDVVDREKIEKIFRMDTPSETDQLKELFLQVDIDAIRASTQIIDYARDTLKKRLNKNVYITLTDHIGFAAQRLKDGITFRNMLNWEIRKFYPKEYAVGEQALDIIQDVMGLEFPEGEAGAIAVHLINAEYDCDTEKTLEVTKIIQKAINVVRLTFRITLDENSLDYHRFVTHMLFFAQRVLENRMKYGEKDFLYGAMKKQYPKEFDCACRIRDLVEAEYKIKLPDDEVTFLCIHIARVIENSKKNK